MGGVLKERAELRRHRFTDIETKGGVVKGSGSMKKQRKLNRAGYLDVLLKLLNKRGELAPDRTRVKK